MSFVDLLERLRASRRAVWTATEIARLAGKRAGYGRLFVHRLVQRGLLIAIERGKYTLKDTNPILVASGLAFPAYVSFLAALAHHGLTTQLPRVHHVVVLRQRPEVVYRGVRIKFVKFTRQRFFGFGREMLEGKTAFVAKPEKAIVDALYLPTYCPVAESWAALSAIADKEAVVGYATAMRSGALAKRLGYLLELLGLDASKQLKVVGGYVRLNPTAAARGERNKKWRVIVNEVLE